MAPEADLIVVKSDLEDTNVIPAIQYIENKAASLGEPVVINMSFGGHLGPHDGTSPYEGMIDALAGVGKLLVVSAGNEGRDNIHASGTLLDGSTEQVNFRIPSGSPSILLDLWYSGADVFGVSLTGPGGNCALPSSGFVYPDTNGTTVSSNLCGNAVITTSAIDSANGDREITISLENSSPQVPPGTWSVTLSGSGCGVVPCVNNGQFDVWVALPDDCAGCVFFADHIDPSKTLVVPATATQVISIGSYATKTSWTGVGGEATDDTVTPGNISTFSSLGPRRSCSNTQNAICTVSVQKPELVAPGEEIMSSYAAGTGNSKGTCFDGSPASKCLDPDGQHHVEQGTSMAAPHVTGAVALLMAAYGPLSVCQVKAALQITRTDESTAVTPNNTWGFGKLAIDLAAANPPPLMSIVPSVVGLTTFNADSALSAAGLAAGTVTLQASATVPAGDVISQSPTPGNCAPQGSNVDLIESAGPATSVVPNVVGLSLAVAQTNIAAVSLTVGTVTLASSATVPAGEMISQNPVAGAIVLQETDVNLVESSGPAAPVPNVVGLTEAAASSAIQNAGLILGPVTIASSNAVPAGIVISENPAAGTSVGPGTTISLVVSSGTPAFTIGVSPAYPLISPGLTQQFTAGRSGAATPALSLSLGHDLSCALLSNGVVECWGANFEGQIGNGTIATNPNVDSVIPAAASRITTAKALSAAGSHACAVLSNGTIECWGINNYDQLGTSSIVTQFPPYCPVIGPAPSPPFCSPTPVTVNGISTALSVATSADLEIGGFSCAVLADGSVECWGDNLHGELGTLLGYGGYADQVPGVTGATAVAAGIYHACALVSSGSIECWGDNSYGQLGSSSLGTPLNSTYGTFYGASSVTGISTAAAVVAGQDHSCALLFNGTVECWGDNQVGQLGNGTTTNAATPVPVTGVTGAIAIAAGGWNTCALLSNGSVQCWGSNYKGELGIGNQAGPATCELLPCSMTPIPVSGIGNATAIAVGYEHVCAILSDGTIQCWGSNYAGELGTGADTPQTSPTPVTVNGVTAALAATWSSSDPNVATITTGGLARAVGGGDTTITATVGTVSTTTVLTVSGNAAQHLNPAVAAVTYPVLFSPAIAVGDFDGDGKPDLAVVEGGSWNVLLGNGNGTFHAAASYAGGGSIVVGDFNGDDIQDVVIGNVLWLGKGDGTFVQSPNPVCAGCGSPFGGSLVAGDFNGDGFLDLAGQGYVLLGNGNGIFSSPINWPTGVPGEGSADLQFHPIAVGDLNGDGKLDIVASNLGGATFSVLLGNGDGTFQVQGSYQAGTGGSGAASVLVGDFNGDGKPDVAVTDATDNAVYVYLGKGDGSLVPTLISQSGIPLGFTAGGAPYLIVGADFNGDGHLDLAVSSFFGSPSNAPASAEPGAVWVLYGNGDGSFQAPLDYPVGSVGSFPTSLVTADFNTDGKRIWPQEPMTERSACY
jgi:beta-lactam-binding protein with PASTA domain